MGRKPNTDLRRQQISLALLQEMAEVGYERASTKSIAARAGLAPGLLHYHFTSKEEILLELVEGLLADAEDRCTTALDSADTAHEKLAAYITARVGFGSPGDAQAVKAWMVVMGVAMAQEAVRALVAQWLARDQARLKALFAKAGASASGQLAATLLAMILGAFTLRSLGVAGVPMAYARPQLLDWLAGVLPAARRPQKPTQP